MSMLGLAGDWHGDLRWAEVALPTLAAAGVREVHHLGDFGMWPGAAGRAFADGVERVCAEHGLALRVTPGNHEDYDQIVRLPREDRGDGMGRVAWLRAHVAILPRGHRWEVGTGAARRTVVSVGGAASVDLEWRAPGRSWWPEEAITDVDVALVETSGAADILLTHDAPTVSTPAVAAILQDNPMGWPEPALRYAATSRRQVARVVAATRPRLHVHGHYHVSDEATVRLLDVLRGDDVPAPAAIADHDTCRIVALDESGRPGNLAVLDLADLHLRRVTPLGDAPR